MGDEIGDKLCLCGCRSRRCRRFTGCNGSCGTFPDRFVSAHTEQLHFL